MVRHPRLAALATVFHPHSHADVMLSRWMKPYEADAAWGWENPKSKISSLWLDQVPENDLGRDFCQRHKIPFCSSIEQALTLGTGSLAVDGVLLIAEHGDYPINALGQMLYPRKELFDKVVETFVGSGKSVPIFCDKHLSWSPAYADEMVATARELGFPLFAGSTLPYCELQPGPLIRVGEPIEEALGLFFDSIEHYGFHSLEFIQSIVENRLGGEVGIRSVVALEGVAVLPFLEGNLTHLLEQAIKMESRLDLNKIKKSVQEGRKKILLFSMEHFDGLKTHHLMLDGQVTGFIAAVRTHSGEIRTARAMMGGAENFYGHFARLNGFLEKMFLTGVAPAPIDRTLLTTHAIAACMGALQAPGIPTLLASGSERKPRTAGVP